MSRALLCCGAKRFTRAKRANIGEPLGADGRARPTEREREARHGLKPREWDALGGGRGLVNRETAREAQIKRWADAKRVPTRMAAWARWAKPCVPQTGRGARHNNTSRPPHTKRSAA